MAVLPGVVSPERNNRRDIQVYLPPGYGSGRRHYPVVYMHDGQNLFDEASAYAGEWQVDETMERLGPLGVEAIIVGIPNMGRVRVDEYSPFVDPRVGGGEGDRYVDFIVRTLKPIIDAEFRTRPEREFTGTIGSSLGGLISLYAFLDRPEVFGFAGAMSPSLWFADQAIFTYAADVPRWTGRLYLDIGTREGRGPVRNVRRMYRLLRRKTTRPAERLMYVEDKDAGHNEAAWARRFEPAIRFLLPRTRGITDG